MKSIRQWHDLIIRRIALKLISSSRLLHRVESLYVTLHIGKRVYINGQNLSVLCFRTNIFVLIVTKSTHKQKISSKFNKTCKQINETEMRKMKACVFIDCTNETNVFATAKFGAILCTKTM